jgi:hypothetical protein
VVIIEKELFDRICKDVEDRKEWANRQPLWYKLRKEGARRLNKPYPRASDKHFPLIDMAIMKLKPTVLNQVFSTERLADFIASEPQDTADVLNVAWWFDYKLKENSNFEDEIDICMDYMYVYGRGILKIYWDATNKRVAFDAIEPIYIIVPDDTKDIRRAPYLVHVKHLSKWDYWHGPESDLYDKKDEQFVARISGGEDDNSYGDEADLKRAQKISEGVTHTSNKDTIILWEIYERKSEKKVLVHTISPYVWDEDIRKPFELTYENKLNPFIDFPLEKIGKSFYSSRGIAELGASFQTYLCKLWNGKSDSIDMWNNPPLSANKEAPLTHNIRCQPGTIIPFAVAPILIGPPPISWDQEMAAVRDLAEQLFMVPDFSMGEKPWDSGKRRSSEKTATESNYIAAVTNQTVDNRNRIFRRKLGLAYQLAWDILYAKDEDMEYLHDEQYQMLDEKLKDKIQSLRPSGSAGAWNTQQRLQKAVQRKMLLGQSPFVKQWELDKMIMELDEPGLVNRLYQDPQAEQKEAREGQMLEMPALELGMPVPADPKDDPFEHAAVVMGYLVDTVASGKQLSPRAASSVQTHLQGHIQAGMQRNPKRMQEMTNQFQQAMQRSIQQRQMRQQIGTAGPGAQPGPGPLAPGPPLPQPQLAGSGQAPM